MIRFLSLIVAYSAVATVIALCGLFGYLLQSGRFEGRRGQQLAALLRGEELPQAPSAVKPEKPVDEEQVPYEAVERMRGLRLRDIELRELSLAQGLKSVRFEQEKLADERTRFQTVRQGFEKQLGETREGAIAAARSNVQQTLENLNPKQAKAQLLEMMEAGELADVVALLAAMPLDKRADIVNEFKTGDEPQKLAEILREMKKGNPEVPLVDETQQQLQPSAEVGQ